MIQILFHKPYFKHGRLQKQIRKKLIDQFKKQKESNNLILTVNTKLEFPKKLRT